MTVNSVYKALMAVAMFAVTLPAWADRDAESATLARLVEEMRALDHLIDQAKAQHDPQSRIRFRYDDLERDLEIIRGAIEDYINQVVRMGQDIQPLVKRYTERGG